MRTRGFARDKGKNKEKGEEGTIVDSTSVKA
jgi:hypothetical protein